MRISKKERGKARTAQLRVILERLVSWGKKDEGVREIDRLPELDVILGELGHYINVKRQTGAGDPAYNGDGGSIYDPTTLQIQIYGLEIMITQHMATRWQWELVKRAISEAGFMCPRSGQCDWWMNLSSRWRIYTGTKQERDTLRPLIVEFCRIHERTCLDVSVQFGISKISAGNFLGNLRLRGVLRYSSRRREYGGEKVRLSVTAHRLVPRWYLDFLTTVLDAFPEPGEGPDQIAEELAAGYRENPSSLVSGLSALFANEFESKKK